MASHPQFEELRLTGNLPSPSGVGMAILRLTQSEEFTADELAHTIQSDPALTGRIVKMANSAQLAAVKPTISVHEAVVRLGVRTVRNIALGFSLVSSYRDGRCRGFDYKRYWSESLGRAIAAQAMSRRLRLVVPAEAYICGLLSGIGRLTLATVHPDAYSAMLKELGPAGAQELADAEMKAFGIHHGDVGWCLLQDWRLPQAHCDAIAGFWKPGIPDPSLDRTTARLRMLLRLAAPFAEMLLEEPERRHYRYTGVREVLHQEKVDESELRAVGDGVAQEWQEWGSVLSVPTVKVEPLAAIAARAEQDPYPAAAAAVAPDMVLAVLEPLPADQPLGQLTVLAVDDDPVSRKLLSSHLKRAGHRVIEGADGVQGLRLALEHNPHLVVTDWMMPEMDGIAMVRSLRLTEIGRDMYVLMLTGTEREERAMEAFQAGADDYVSKPFNPSILVARVAAGERVVRLRDELAKDKARLRDQMAQLAILNRKLSQSVVTDALTGLPNRRHAMATLERVWTEHPGAGEVSLILVDVDGFRSFNERHGPQVGDAVLRALAERLRGLLRESDTVCRLGDEEFVVICPGCPESAARSIAERLRAAVETMQLEAGNGPFALTVSAGVAERSDSMASQDELLRAADAAVHAAKSLGRNRVMCASEALSAAPAPSES